MASHDTTGRYLFSPSSPRERESSSPAGAKRIWLPLRLGEAVRPGLVTVGVAFLVLGGATLAAVHLFPGGPPTDQQTTVVPPVFVNSHGGGQQRLTGVNSSNGAFHVHRSSTTPLTVALYDAPGCAPSGACVLTQPLASWPANASGNATFSGALAFPFVLVWTNPGPSPGSFSADAVETYHPDGGLPALTTLLIDGTAGTLVAVGAVGLFLGLFLRGGVYSRPPPAPPGPGP